MVEFFQSWELWIQAVIASIIIGALGGLIGIFIIARRVVFISMALSQVSALGVAAAILIGEIISHTAMHNHHESSHVPIYLNPSLWSMVFAVAASLALGSGRKPRKITSESLIGMIYLLAGGFVLVIASKMAAHAHEIDNVLFGNAVAITTGQLIELLVVCGIVIGISVFYIKDFLFVTFDEEAAQAIALPVRRIKIIFYILLAAFISTATRTIGGFPVFAFLVLPAMGALAWTNTITGAFTASAVFGAASAFLGYLISFFWELPTGACMVITAGFFIVINYPLRFFSRTMTV